MQQDIQMNNSCCICEIVTVFLPTKYFATQMPPVCAAKLFATHRLKTRKT